jgi:hypothetical protein
MEILDPDLWDDDGTAKKPTQEYMKNLEEAQVEAQATFSESYLNYARIKREAKAARSPEVGDIVHFWAGGPCRAAIVMEAESFSDVATLRVHIPNEPFQDWTVDHNEDKASEGDEFSWHWPCGEGQ